MARRKRSRKTEAELRLVKAERVETEVREKPKRRTFTTAYKRRILEETDAAVPGTIAAILRREGLYSSHLTKWRAEREEGLSKKRGRKGNPLTAENRRLRAECARLEKKLNQANEIIELQKKVSEILGIARGIARDE